MTDAPRRAGAAAPAARSVSRSHPGLRRAVNEDRVLERPGDGLWAVADGMGGHREGDRAADRLIASLGAVEPGLSGYARLTEVARQVEAVNAELFGRGVGAGATLVALIAHEGHYACLWAGDSRAYRLRDGALSPITRDHSVVQELVESGALRAGERRGHPMSHVITRAVGAGREIELERRFAPIQPGDVFLLCSDGLTACLDDAELAQGVNPADLEASADALLAAALARGAPDNVSLVLAAPRG